MVYDDIKWATLKWMSTACTFIGLSVGLFAFFIVKNFLRSQNLV